jgi:hypothetical protein
VANYLSHLAAVFPIADAEWGFRLSTAAMNEALKVTKALGYTGKSVWRERRPTLDELYQLAMHFAARCQRRREIAVVHLLLECVYAHVLTDQLNPLDATLKLYIPHTLYVLPIFAFALATGESDASLNQAASPV